MTSDDEIFKKFGIRCVRCQTKAVTIHELVPRSKRPKTWDTEDNRVPLCSKCHDWAHSIGTRNSRPILEKYRNLRLSHADDKQ